MKKRWMLGVVVAFVLITVLVLLYGKGEDKSSTPAAAASVAIVQKGNITVNVTGSGSIAAADREQVKTKDTAKIKAILFKEGDIVKKGQTLVTFEAEDVSSKLKQEMLNLEKKQMDLQQAQEQYKEQTDETQREAGKMNLNKLQLDIEQLQDSVASIKEQQVPKDALVAPIGGQASAVNASTGEEMKPGTVITELVDYDSLEMVVPIDELDISQIKKGQKAEVTVDALPDKKFEGEVVKIAQEGTSQNGVANFDVTIKLVKHEGVLAGMSAEASILVAQKENTLLVPIEAVHETRGKKFVMLAGGDASETGAKDAQAQMQMKEVKVGIHNEDRIEIVSGLTEGEQVMLPETVKKQNTAGGFGGFGTDGRMPGGGMQGGGNRNFGGGSGGSSNSRSGGGSR